jgi:hypothetical protein
MTIREGYILDKPKSWEFFINSTYYKVGSHGFVFMWNNGGWVRSSKKTEDLTTVKRKSMARKRSKVRGKSKKSLILEAIKCTGKLTAEQLQQVLGLGKEALRGALKDLCYEDKLVNKDGFYSVPVRCAAFHNLSIFS